LLTSRNRLFTGVPVRGCDRYEMSGLAALFAPGCAQEKAKSERQRNRRQRAFFDRLFNGGAEVLANAAQGVTTPQAGLGDHIIQRRANAPNPIFDVVERLIAGRAHQVGDFLGEGAEILAQRAQIVLDILGRVSDSGSPGGLLRHGRVLRNRDRELTPNTALPQPFPVPTHSPSSSSGLSRRSR